MPDWLNRWIGKRPAASLLAMRLRSYPPFDAPFTGYGPQLTVAQAEANLGYFERVLPQRLQQLASLLRDEAGIGIAPALAAPREHAAGLTDALHRWAAVQWPPLLALRQPPPERSDWLASHRRGEDIAFSMVLDVAILLGELIRRANPDWRWGLDRDATNLQDDMASARRVVLLAAPVGEMKYPFVTDVEDIVAHRFLNPSDPAQQLLNPWRRLVEEGIRGDDFIYWRTTAAGANPS